MKPRSRAHPAVAGHEGAYFVARGIDLASNTPEAFGHLIKSEAPRYRKFVENAGAKAD